MIFRPLNVLISHECSGAICREFRALGHSAFSCDLLPRTDGNTSHHIQGDGIAAMRAGRPTDGKPWELVIAHPACTRLANSGVLRLYRGGKKVNGIDSQKWNEMNMGAIAFRRVFEAFDGALCVENPVMHGYASAIIGDVGAQKQSVQPHEFGDDASKATVLWLRNLPMLTIDPAQACLPRSICPKCHTVEQGAPDLVKRALANGCLECGAKCLPRWANQTDSGQNKLPPSAGRAAARAVTYPGIARAMAVQWSEYLLSK